MNVPHGTFPLLHVHGYRETSVAQDVYNCFAWALEKDDVRIDPSPGFFGYWPVGVPFDGKRDCFVAMFAEFGYTFAGAEPPYEDDLRVIAVYENPALFPTHAARRIAPGAWSSKIGDLEDIEHSLAAIEGGDYGRVAFFMYCKGPGLTPVLRAC